jgi:hypothetical protein
VVDNGALETRAGLLDGAARAFLRVSKGGDSRANAIDEDTLDVRAYEIDELDVSLPWEDGEARQTFGETFLQVEEPRSSLPRLLIPLDGIGNEAYRQRCQIGVNRPKITNRMGDMADDKGDVWAQRERVHRLVERLRDRSRDTCFLLQRGTKIGNLTPYGGSGGIPVDKKPGR